MRGNRHVFVGMSLVLCCGFHVTSFAADTAADKESSAELAELRSALANQQKQIDTLRLLVEEQQKRLEDLAGRRERRELATAVTPAPPKIDTTALAPLQLHIGAATITPVGFMDLTSVWRSTNP